LPTEVTQLQKILVNPGRGSTLDQLNGFSNGQRCRHRLEQMNVVCGPADASWFDAVLFGDAA
jgi:hypothetical protein